MDRVHIKPNIEIAQIISGKPSKVFGEIPTMFLGRYTNTCICRVLFKFSIADIPEDAVIINAKFNIASLFKTMGIPPRKVTPYALTENWSLNEVNWNNQPDYNKEIYGQSLDINKGMAHKFDITSIVRKWHDNDIPNCGIIIKNDEIMDNNYVKLITDMSMSSAPTVGIFYQLRSECICKVIQTQFIEKIEEIETDASYNFSIIRDTSLIKTVTYFVKNIGENLVEANLEISPDRFDFIEDSGTTIIKKNQTIRLVPYVFAKFTRVRVKNINENEKSRVRIWFQAQK